MIKTIPSCFRRKWTILGAMVVAIIMVYGFGLNYAAAATVEVDDFTIERSYSNDYVVTVKSYDGNATEVTLPTKATIDEVEYTITCIGDGVFQDNHRITSVTIPEGYTEISLDAFSGAAKLQKVEIPGSVTDIYSSAFKGCTALTTVNFAEDTADSLSLGNDVFMDCTSLPSLTLPARLDDIGNNFVRGCHKLTSLTIKDGAKNFFVEENVLYRNIDETTAELAVYPFGKIDTEYTVPSVVNGKTITAIGPHAFRGNAVLQKVTLPASVKNLERYAFEAMTAIQEITLQTTSVPTLGSEVCTNMAAGSKIIVANAEVAAVFEPQDWYTYYTPANTTVEVAGAVETKVDAALSITAEAALQENNVVYHVYLDSANNVNTVLFKVAFDSAQVNQGDLVSANAAFDVAQAKWETAKGQLVLTGYLGKTGNESGYTTAEKVELATITVPLQNDVKGSIAATLTKAACAGVSTVEEDSMTGMATITEPATAILFIADYDVNSDGQVDILDIADAQRYYKAKTGDEHWSEIQKMDVNGDGQVDIEDYIAIFNQIVDF